MGNLYGHNFPSKKCYGRPDIGNVVSRLGCQHFISAWLGKLKPNKLSTGCQNELKGAAVEKATKSGQAVFYFCCGLAAPSRALCVRISRPAALPLLRPARQNRHATQANENLIDVNSGLLLSFLTKILSLFLIHIKSDCQVRTQNTFFLYNTSWCGSLLLLTVRTGV